MVEYRVVQGPKSKARPRKKAVPVEVNALRHEGKSPTYSQLIHSTPLYDFFFKDLGDGDADAMCAHMMKAFADKRRSVCVADVPEYNEEMVAAMIFARKPSEEFLAHNINYAKWVGHLRGLSVSSGSPLAHEERFAHSDGNFFFGVAMGYFPRWSALDELLVPKYEEQFIIYD